MNGHDEPIFNDPVDRLIKVLEENKAKALANQDKGESNDFLIWHSLQSLVDVVKLLNDVQATGRLASVVSLVRDQVNLLHTHLKVEWEMHGVEVKK